jgi:hypothetical protein
VTVRGAHVETSLDGLDDHELLARGLHMTAALIELVVNGVACGRWEFAVGKARDVASDQ